MTAQRVAAYRLSFERLPAPYGDPAGDERLARDVAGAGLLERSERVERYLRARTGFFDRVVVNALEREVSQVVLVGAGYDGRALRYAKPGVRWFELDHPSTQQDKRARLEALGIEAPQVTFLAVDLRGDGLAGKLVEGGFEPDAVSVLICEGVAAYLERRTIEMLLCEARSLTTVGTRFALSFSPVAGDGGTVRQHLRERVAAAGEPIRSSLTAADAASLLGSTRWRPSELSETAGRLGFVVAAPVWEPAPAAAPPTRSRVGGFLEQVLYRTGEDTLAAHLEATYGIEVAGRRELDLGVYRIELRGGRPWIARVFPASRPVEAVENDAASLRMLERASFPAERLAHERPVSLHHGQPVLVTQYVDGKRAAGNTASLTALGALLGSLHSLPFGDIAALDRGGCWHHLAPSGGPREEIVAAVALLEAAEARLPDRHVGACRGLRAALASADAGEGLPEALIHPDFVAANTIAAPHRELVLVDWTAAGRAPRLWSLAWLLYSAGARNLRHVDAVMVAYTRAVKLEPDELSRLASIIWIRPAVLEAWAFATGRKQADQALHDLTRARELAAAVARRAVTALRAP